MKDKTSTENAIFLRNHYQTNGAGFYVRNQQYAIWYDASGIRLSAGTTAQWDSAYLITWEQAALRIRELLDEGRYIPQSELQDVTRLELEELAERLLHLYGCTEILRTAMPGCTCFPPSAMCTTPTAVIPT